MHYRTGRVDPAAPGDAPPENPYLAATGYVAPAQAAVTQAGFFPGYINATRNADGTVRVTLRSKADWEAREQGKTVQLQLSRTEWGQFLSSAVGI